MQPIWGVHIRTVFWLVSNNGHIKVRSNQDDPDGRVSDGGDLNRSNCYRSFALVLYKLVSIDNSIRDDWGNRNASIFPSRNTISKPATRLKRFICDADYFSDFWGITY